MARDVRNVFVNVPFDDVYAPLFDALVFAIMACGYRVRCALEADDSGDIRLDKLVALIRESPRSIHDLSRIDLGENDLPRFNMPFDSVWRWEQDASAGQVDVAISSRSW